MSFFPLPGHALRWITDKYGDVHLMTPGGMLTRCGYVPIGCIAVCDEPPQGPPCHRCHQIFQGLLTDTGGQR